jgi:Iron-containing redox enzyme
VLGRMPPPAVATLVGCQYYWLHHFHPLAFLGYIGFMEGYPPTPELVETLIERTGYPRPAFQTFAEHAELDPGHRDHLDRVLDALPLTQEQETVLGVSAMTTADLATRALREVLDSER